MSRTLRWIAHVVAGGSLAMLGWQSFQPEPDPPPPTTEVTLWTAGTVASTPLPGTHVALPDATDAPAGALRIPDAAFLRRTFPSLQRIVIEGDGVDTTDASALRGLDVTWHVPGASPRGAPFFAAVSAPRTLPVGQHLEVQGRVRGMRPGETITANLTGSDGSTQSVEVRASPEGDGAFSLRSGATAVAPGAFEWKLRLGPNGETLVLGAEVTRPELPRVLILQVSPNVEGGRLQRWLAEAGAPVTSRTRVSAEHVRFAAANRSAAEFAAVDATVLASFDVVVAREAALADLLPAERTALEAAVQTQGLGLLVTGEPGSIAIGALLAPWQFRADDTREAGDAGRGARLRLHVGTALAEPISVEPAEIVLPGSGRWLVRDSQAKTLGAALRHGRGWIARILVSDTWRWLQGGHPKIYATYWSGVLSAVARPVMTPGGRWSLENGTRPIFVGEAVRLSWIGPPDTAIPATETLARYDPSAAPVKLKLTRDSAEPLCAEALYWPAHAGWHEVRTTAAGASLAFYVQPRETLPGFRAEHRHDATARLRADGSGASMATLARNAERSVHRFADYVWFVFFVMSAGWLWLGQRR
ncbi:MAG: hypothetical protein EXS37_15205 [Opitutus sp.]|nr:hypothetical protein [Opitutus sp.]